MCKKQVNIQSTCLYDDFYSVATKQFNVLNFSLEDVRTEIIKYTLLGEIN